MVFAVVGVNQSASRASGGMNAPAAVPSVLWSGEILPQPCCTSKRNKNTFDAGRSKLPRYTGGQDEDAKPTKPFASVRGMGETGALCRGGESGY